MWESLCRAGGGQRGGSGAACVRGCSFCVVVVLFCVPGWVLFCGVSVIFIVSVPERSKGVDSSSTVFALVGSNPTADKSSPFPGACAFRLDSLRQYSCCVSIRAASLFVVYGRLLLHGLPSFPRSFIRFRRALSLLLYLVLCPARSRALPARGQQRTDQTWTQPRVPVLGAWTVWLSFLQVKPSS